MIKEIPSMDMPDWLYKLDPGQIDNSALPLREMLTRSLYYPASGADGDPVKYLAGNVFSFIYADYGIERANLRAELEKPGFRGYQIIANREVRKEELIPHGWIPRPLECCDGDPTRRQPETGKPFAEWFLAEREREYGEDHGPSRFSLLFVCGDGAATYQALFHASGCRPLVVAIIQPGHGFGGNWTNFEDPDAVMARSVRQNVAGAPEYLLYGGRGSPSFYERPCWPEYSELVCRLKHGRLGLWRCWRELGGREISGTRQG